MSFPAAMHDRSMYEALSESSFGHTLSWSHLLIAMAFVLGKQPLPLLISTMHLRPIVATCGSTAMGLSPMLSSTSSQINWHAIWGSRLFWGT